MSRDDKQCDVGELKVKGPCCRLRCTSEAVFSFFENVGPLCDGVPCDNATLIPCALECGCALKNSQKPLIKPGKNYGLPENYWD